MIPLHVTKAVSLVNKKWTRILDFGCGDGILTRRLTRKGRQIYGCDIDREVLAVARKRIKKVSFSSLKKDGKTIYRDNFFDCVFLMGVLEHVPDEKSLLTEVRRILKPGGSLIIYGINKGLFHNFDAANLKFIAPGFHRLLYRILVGRKEYEKEFVEKKDKGMFGDFTFGKEWHTHYSLSDLKKLVRNNFKIVTSIHYGLFSPFLLAGDFVSLKLRRRGSAIFENLIKLDARFSHPDLSYLFIVEFKKL